MVCDYKISPIDYKYFTKYTLLFIRQYIVNHYTFFVSILRHESRDHWQSTVDTRKNPSSCIIPQPHPLSLVNKPTLF